MAKYKLLVTDLDNTLFDWFAQWEASFSALLAETVRISGIPREKLIEEIRAVHQHLGTTEVTRLLSYLPSIGGKPEEEATDETFRAAYEARTAARKAMEVLYPTVRESLETLRAHGVRIVGYTESRRFVTVRRIRKLGLDGLLDRVYLSPDHAAPPDARWEDVRTHGAAEYTPQITGVYELPEGVRKPNPAVLLDIVRDIGVKPEETVYIGDSLMKDVAMALEANVFAVHALYGESHNKSAYNLLRSVSHWTPEMIAEEARISADKVVVPQAVAREAFSAIVPIVLGVQDEPSATDRWKERVKAGTESWKTAVATQQHFNDIQLRVRTLAITFVTALMGVAGVMLKEDPQSYLPAALALVGLVSTFAFYRMDRHWYHVFLRGASIHVGEIEKDMNKVVGEPVFGLANAISVASQADGKGSQKRLDSFYRGLVIAVLLAASLLALFAWSRADGSVAPTAGGVSDSSTARPEAPAARDTGPTVSAPSDSAGAKRRATAPRTAPVAGERAP